jgi:hypothetical protein
VIIQGEAQPDHIPFAQEGRIRHLMEVVMEPSLTGVGRWWRRRRQSVEVPVCTFSMLRTRA